MIDGIPYVRFTAPDGSTAAAAIPIGSIHHPEQTHWIRNGYFDRLKSAVHAARAIIIHNKDQRAS